MPAVETTTEENMTLNMCPLTFIQKDDHFYLQRQDDLLEVEGYKPKNDTKNTDPIEIKDGYMIKTEDGKKFQVAIKDETLNIAELSFPNSSNEDTEKGIFTYNINGVEVTVTEAKNGQSTVSFSGNSEVYKYRETPAIEITPGYSIHLTSAHEGPTRVILHKKRLTNLDQS